MLFVVRFLLDYVIILIGGEEIDELVGEGLDACEVALLGQG